MDGLADLSIQHFQMRSDLNELLHKCAMPVPVRKGAPIDPTARLLPWCSDLTPLSTFLQRVETLALLSPPA